MQRFYTYSLILSLFIAFPSVSQSVFSGSTNLTGNLGNNATEDTEGTIAISSSLQSVSGGNASFIKYEDYANYYGVSLSFGSVAVANRLRARAGEQFSITINTKRKKFGNQTGPYAGADKIRIRYGIGKNEQTFRYDVDIQNMPNTEIPDPDDKLQTFTINHTFSVGRSEAWIVLEVLEPNAANFVNPYYTTIVIPVVVEGPTEAIVDSLGVTTEPKKPFLVLHQPPGKQSTASIISTQKTCRSYEETYETDETNSARAAVKFGYKGSLGIGVTVDTEIYAQYGGGVSSNDVEIRTKSDETCVEVTNAISTVALATANNAGTKGDLFIGYGIDLVYGVSRNVNIKNNVIIIDTGLVYAPIPGTMRQFVHTKATILEDIKYQTAIMNNLSLSDKDRATAEYQIDTWNKTLQLNETNIAQATANPAGILTIKEFSPGSNESFSGGLDYTSTTSIETKKYFEFNVGFDFLVDIGGSGYSGGYQFTSRSSYGARKSSSSNNGTVIAYDFIDTDLGDLFKVGIYRDPMFGTPVFKLLSGSRTSCPFEGGYQLDQPSLEFNGFSGKSRTLNNITLGTPANVKINICNNSDYERSYVLKVKEESLPSNMTVLANGGANITSSPITLTVPENSCLFNRDVDITRTLPTVPTEINNLVLEWYPDCEPTIKDSLVINANWATPPPPVLGALPLENNNRYIFLCQGEQDVTLSTNCSNGTVPHWYTSEVGGLLEGTGSPYVVSNINPNTRTSYYVSCESDDYISPRVFYGSLFPSLEPTVNNLSLSGFTQFGFYVANETLEVSAFNINRSYLPTAYRAGRSVTLLPGFETLGERAAFTAEIGGCPE